MPQPKILTLDVETVPALAYTWGTNKQYISHDNIIDPGGMICAAWKWLGKTPVEFGAEWTNDATWMARMAEAIADADAVVTYNGNGFDLPKIKGELVRRGLPPLPPVRSIDLYRTVAGLGYPSGKLAFIAPLLSIGQKVETGGYGLWKRVREGDPKACRLMEKYNKEDVRLTERLYKRLAPYISQHPAVHGTSCPSCGSNTLQRRGYNVSRVYRTERLQCQACGHWSQGKRTKIT